MGLRAMMVTGATSTANNLGLAGGLVACTAGARLYSITVMNNSGSDAYVQVFDAAAVPADTTVPKLCMKVLNDSQGSFDYGDGRIFLTGISIAFSSSAATLTAVTTASSIIDCTYRQT